MLAPVDEQWQAAVVYGIMRRPWDAIIWWEIRRIPFNVIILVAGICSFLVIQLIGARLVKPGEDVVEPLAVMVGAVVYAVAANLCYTLGWVTELLWSRGDTCQTEAIRPKIYRKGIIFSVALTISPAALVPLAWLIWGFK